MMGTLSNAPFIEVALSTNDILKLIHGRLYRSMTDPIIIQRRQASTVGLTRYFVFPSSKGLPKGLPTEHEPKEK